MDMRDMLLGLANRQPGMDPFARLRQEIDRVFEDAYRCAAGGAEVPRCANAVGETGPRCANAIGEGGQSCAEAIGGSAARGAGQWPGIAVGETDAAYIVTAELPGMDESNVEVAVVGDALVLQGEKTCRYGDAKQHMSELYSGRFERRLPLGADVDRDGITAAFRNGVMTITLPKAAAATAPVRKIPISGG